MRSCLTHFHPHSNEEVAWLVHCDDDDDDDDDVNADYYVEDDDDDNIIDSDNNNDLIGTLWWSLPYYTAVEIDQGLAPYMYTEV